MARSAPVEFLDRALSLMRRHVGNLSVVARDGKVKGDVDLILKGHGRSFALEWKSRDDAPIIAEAIAQLKRHAGWALGERAVRP